MGFIKYLGKQGTGNRIQEGFVRLTRHKKGAVTITFNKYDAINHLGDNTHVELFYDDSTRTIALRPCRGRLDGAIKIVRGQATTVGVSGFFSQFGIALTGTATGAIRFSDGMLMVCMETLSYDLTKNAHKPTFIITRN